MDLGPEYRSLMGLPGGTKHAAYPAIFEAAKQAGFKLTPGKGNDPDTLGKQLIFVYDTNEFPFYQAEIYHQYHVSYCMHQSGVSRVPAVHNLTPYSVYGFYGTQ